MFGPINPPSNGMQPIHQIPTHMLPHQGGHGPVLKPPAHGSGPVMPPSNSMHPLQPGMGPVGPLPPFHKVDPRLKPLGPPNPLHGSGPVMPPSNSMQPLGPPRPLHGIGPVMPHEYGCHFPAPAPFRVYCQPAQFHRVNGQEYGNLTVAYGSSRPAPNKIY